jgi:hypothetical protein
MPITKESAQTLVNEILQELSEINARRKQLEELLNNLNKLIDTEGPKPTIGEIIRTPIPIAGVGEASYRRKSSHAIKMVKILEHSGKAMRVPEIVEAYPEQGWAVTKTLATGLHKTITDRPDLFIRIGNGYVDLKERHQ